MRNRLAIESRFDQLRVLTDWVRELVAHYRLPPAVAYRLDLVLTEAVTNIIEHGCNNGTDRRWIRLECRHRDDAIEIELRDNAAAFDPTSRAGLVHADQLHEATPEGRGIHLIRQFTSGLYYRREGECNILGLTFATA